MVDDGDLEPEDLCTVRNAWAAVGISPEGADVDCDGDPDVVGPDGDRDGVSDATDNCPAVWSSQ